MRDSSRTYLTRRRTEVDAWLDRLLPAETVEPTEIHRAMRYVLFAGGKRIRPLFTVAVGDVFNAPQSLALPIACAIEMIHTYSLVHDDLPSMDNDDLRRGRPTCHKVFGEAMAILTGDALLTLAFETLSSLPSTAQNASNLLEITSEIARSAGTMNGMVGGQVLDLLNQGRSVSREQLEVIHRSKTGALLRASILGGAMAGDPRPNEMQSLKRYAEDVGLAFQIVDDLLDVTSTTENLGKTAGKDESVAKATYPSILGMDQSRQLVNELLKDALEQVKKIDRPAEILADLAEHVTQRSA